MLKTILLDCLIFITFLTRLQFLVRLMYKVRHTDFTEDSVPYTVRGSGLILDNIRFGGVNYFPCSGI